MHTAQFSTGKKIVLITSQARKPVSSSMNREFRTELLLLLLVLLVLLLLLSSSLSLLLLLLLLSSFQACVIWQCVTHMLRMSRSTSCTTTRMCESFHISFVK